MSQTTLLLSMSPESASAVVDGKKAIDLRRKFPREIPKGSRVLIYATSPVSKVIGEARIDSVESLDLTRLWKKVAEDAPTDREAFDEYFDDLESGFAIRVTGARRYRQPKELEPLTGITRPPRSYRYV